MGLLLSTKQLTVSYDSKVVLENANMEIHHHDFIGVIGPNGGGKTTLLKAILGLIPISKGEIIFGSELESNTGKIGYLPQVKQFDQRYPISVFEVVRSGLAGKRRWYQAFSKEENEKVEAVIAELGIEQIIKKPVGELSGGQMQRVFLARAIVSKPKLLLLDEPETFVDNQFEGELYQKLNELNKHMAILLVSHDVGTITSYVKSIACVNRELHYHPSNIISQEQLAGYNCPIQIITHGQVPHTVLGDHEHKHHIN